VAESILPPDNEFRNVLNSHGHSFQYSIIRLAEKLYEKRKSGWIFEWAEFPVSARNKDARIDLILRRGNSLTYMVGECKRVNPALGRWCFARAPYTHRLPNEQMLLVESIDVTLLDRLAAIDPRLPLRLLHSISSARALNIFHLGLELKTNEKGDSQGSRGRGAIEDALGQVLLGVNGMVEHIARHHEMLQPGYKVSLVPVIFTTATLWTSEVDLGAADLATGNLAPDTLTVTPQSWLWLNYNQSPSLKHAFPMENTVGRDVLETEYTRSIAIVNASGVEDFFQRCEF